MLKRRGSYLPIYSNYWDDFFGRNLVDHFFSDEAKANCPTANIIENEKDFQIELAIPGYKKDNFSVEINKNILTIKGEVSQEEEESKKQYTRREHCFSSFERHFTLPETINAEKIDAAYDSGMLLITLPKKEQKELETSKVIKIK
ncbi:MAG: Hsp20/alpha crystallin family protein [Bacteroidales bacterium]|jgi:HSP20 family protein|nr:Hsp20/alpha crystallin family protein [Bacteroidales bacterium]